MRPLVEQEGDAGGAGVVGILYELVEDPDAVGVPARLGRWRLRPVPMRRVPAAI